MNELDVFSAVIAIADPRERIEFLDRECAGQPELRQRRAQLSTRRLNRARWYGSHHQGTRCRFGARSSY